MKIKIDNKKKIFPKYHPVNRLSSLVVDNKMLLIAISKIHTGMGMIKKPTDTEITIIVENSLDNLVLTEDITTEVAERFLELWTTMDDNDKGKLLEEIISQCGPYKFRYNSIGYSSESKVYQTGQEKNFDIIFYEEDTAKIFNRGKFVEIKGKIEFHECKKNVCNYIPCNDNNLRRDVKNKLEFIKEVKKMSCNSGFFIPTFHYDTSGQQNFLDDKGYGFIEIININHLIEKYL